MELKNEQISSMVFVQPQRDNLVFNGLALLVCNTMHRARRLDRSFDQRWICRIKLQIEWMII
jgi:hypothetical protein